jgi:hypothetical protein
VPDPADTPSRIATALAVVRLVLVAVIFVPAWCASAAVALVVLGARAGWRDMRSLQEH